MLLYGSNRSLVLSLMLLGTLSLVFSVTAATDEQIHAAIGKANPGYIAAYTRIQQDKNQIYTGRSSSIVDLRPFVDLGFKNIKIETCPALKDLSPLAGSDVESITLVGAESLTDQDFAVFARMPKLNTVQLEDVAVRDISWVKDLSLKVLSFEGCWRLRDISPIRNMKQVQTLNLNETSVRDISPLVGKKIFFLHLASCPITDFSPLKSIPVGCLTLDGTLFDDPKLLEGKPLWLLRVNCPGITSLEFVNKLPRLEVLELPAHRLDYTPLKDCPKLARVGVAGQEYEVKKFWNDYVARLPKQTKDVALPVVGQPPALSGDNGIKYRFADVRNNVVLIEHDKGVGSGFLLQAPDGKTYIYTNQHVVAGAKRFRIKLLDGRKFSGSDFEVADRRDVVRFPIDAKSGFKVAPVIKPGEPVVVYGNSGGGGVFTELYGRVQKVTDDQVQVSTKFIQGNSGSPILNDRKEVLGIATYVMLKPVEADWLKGDKHFAKVERYAFRIDTGLKWRTMKWKEYAGYGQRIADDRAFAEETFSIAVRWLQQPWMVIPDNDVKDVELRRWLGRHNSFARQLGRARSKGYIEQDERNKLRQNAQNNIKQLTKTITGICLRRKKSIERELDSESKKLTTYFKNEMKLNIDYLDHLAEKIPEAAGEISSSEL